MALAPVDKLLAGYLGLVTVVILLRAGPADPTMAPLLGMHALFGALLYLFTRVRASDAVGVVLRDFYPLIMLLPLYAEIGILGLEGGIARALVHDAVVQRWEASLFGTQWSYEWIRRHPSVFWSGTFHLAYFAYYPIVLLGPLLLWVRGRHDAARQVIFVTMVAFVACYVVFLLFPVAGPYYAFGQPRGAVRDVWSAQLVYGILSGGSSFGAAFPSSHVAATVAATLAVARSWKGLAAWFAIPCALLTIGTVYCQMHYVVDAAGGVLVGIGAWLVAGRTARADQPRG